MRVGKVYNSVLNLELKVLFLEDYSVARILLEIYPYRIKCLSFCAAYIGLILEHEPSKARPI